MRPFKLHVGPAVYDITAEPNTKDEHGAKMAGQVWHDSEKVLVDDSLPERSQQITILHELLHSILQQAGQRKWYEEEGLLDAVAYGLMGTKVETDDGTVYPLLGPLLRAIGSGGGDEDIKA